MNLAALIIAYSRPTGILNLLNSLISNGVTRVYISIDGPKNARDLKNQKIIQTVIHDYSKDKSIQIKILKQEINLGIAVAVIGAIDWFFAQEDYGLILEDDLLISSDFLNFASLCLDEYSDNPNVWMISGSQLLSGLSSESETIWVNYPMIWGWATWENKWKKMRSSLIENKKTTFSKAFNYRYYYWKVGAKRVLSGKVDTWDTPLAFEFRVQNKFCILPPINLVSNIGFDALASNTTKIENGIGKPIQNVHKPIILTLEPEIKQVKNFNLKLESEIFHIRYRHLLLPLVAFLFDNFKFPKKMRKDSLIRRLSLFKVL
jgi:hypothetical protein